MFGRPIPEFRPDEAALARIQGTFSVLLSAIQRCVDAGAFAPADSAETAVHLQALAHGLSSLELRGALGTEQEAERHWRSALQATIRGLRRHPD